ncbi:MAG: hypothetical protein IJW82_08445 [Clostridia bacterium]|nr:hypothetical protein [Clostridia bacterium]
MFIEKALVLKINFNVEDTNAVITGNTTLYSKYNSNLFYYDVLCTKMGTTPLVRKQKIGYTVELDGWYIDNQKVMTKNGALLPNISNITNENGMFVTTNELTLVAKIKETPFTYYVNFCVGENEAINGESKLYISYDDNVFYLEEEKVTTRPIPTAQKHIEGYDSIFLGWYESTNANSSKFIDKNGNFVEGRVFKNGKFANLSSLTMYAKFEITPKVIEISFNCETIIPLEYDKVYVKYNSSIFYKEKECINQVEIPVPKKEIEGYECNFVGYFIEEEYTNKVFDYKGNIRQNVLDITNKYYNWIGLNDLTLYAKFDIKKIIYKIKIDSMEGELENENQHTIFVPYDSNKYYLTQDCEEEITTFPNSILNQKGYDTQLIGYYTQAENGEKIVDESLKIQSSVLGFTNENGNWTRLEDCTIYARYNLEPKTIKINFSSVDNENNTIIIQGNVDYYVKFDSNTFYSDVELQNEITQFPTIKEQDNDFDYNFFGWCIKNEQDHIRLIDENGNLCKVVNYTCYDLNDEFCICTDQDITLIPCYTKQGVTIMLTFNTEEKEQQLTGNQTYYCKFGSKELYKDHSCQNETQELPKVTQEVIGYSSEFLGWYSGSGQLIFDKNLVMQQNADGVIKDGTWQFSNSIILYPKFNLIPNMYQITLDSQDGTLEGYQEKKVLTLFVEYGSNVIYIDRQKTQEAHLVNAEKNIQGYNSTFIGWEDENGNIIFKNGEKDLIASIPTLTDKKGNWIATKDLILTSKFLDEAIISKIILNVVDSQTENNIASIYVKYDDKNIYYDEYCLNALEKFPSSTRQVDGYTFNFSGWFELQESQKMVVSSDCQIVNFNEFYYNGWKVIKTLNLYPQFNQNQNMYEIEFINKYTTDSKVGYILYNSSTIYQDKDLMNEFAYLPTCEKMGYDVEFIGWELKNENQLLIDIEYKFLSVLGYVREGNYYYTNNLKVYANFKFIPRLYTITINYNGGKIENLQ